MTGDPLLDLFVLPIGFGLLGFVEPCSIGATLLFIKTLEGNGRLMKVAQVGAFAAARAVFIGLLGAIAVLVGSAFFGFQRAAWLLLGTLYVALGLLYLVGKSGWVMRTLGPRLRSLANVRGSAALGLFFGLNIPACAAPLLLALLGASAAAGARGGTLQEGFVALALFGFALSLPLAVAVPFAAARRALDWLAALSRRLPFWTGVLFVLLGLWSIRFALIVSAPTT